MNIKKYFLFCLSISFFFMQCKKNDTQQPVSLKAMPIKGHSCESCGMIVREQSSPRGQIVHRDGKRSYFCSLSDMMNYLENPSPHGKVLAIFVESMDAKIDPLVFDTKPQPWLPASQGTYVLGVKKTRVMGVPILSYKDPKDAHLWGQKYKGKSVSWTALHDAWKHARRSSH